MNQQPTVIGMITVSSVMIIMQKDMSVSLSVFKFNHMTQC